MAGETTYTLGGVALSYAKFVWPKYRGTVARMIDVPFAANLYDDLAKHVAGLGGKPTTLTISGPATAGNVAADDARTIYGVYVVRISKDNDEVGHLVLADARWTLSQRVMDLDFLLKFGDDYLEGTDLKTFKEALQATIKSVDVLTSGVGGTGVARVDDRKMKDGQHLSGMTLAQALQMLCDAGNLDFTVDNYGKMHFVDRLDLLNYAAMPAKDAYDWLDEPTWPDAACIVTGRPREIWGYYNERHCLRLEFSTAEAVQRKIPDELHITLEQVYSDEGVIYTLKELLDARGATALGLSISDSDIAKCYMTDKLEGTFLEDWNKSADAIAIITAIKDGWRRLWRIIYPKSKGQFGGWTDFKFGKLNADGSIMPVAVDCKWVKFYGAVQADTAKEDFLGQFTTANFPEPAPFIPVWEGDESSGVIRLRQKALADQSLALPGELVGSDGFTPYRQQITRDDSNALRAKGIVDILKGYPVRESEPREKARFAARFDLGIYLCATKRMPNDETKWHKQVADGFKDGDIDHVELPVPSDTTMNRDYVHTTAPVTYQAGVGYVADPGFTPHPATSDGFGYYLNADEINNSMNVRAAGWKSACAASFEGDGTAERHQLFFDRNVEGPIAEIILEFDEEIVRTRMVVGNLSDEEAKKRIETKRLAERKMIAAGKAVG